jgi:hypothetical protein
VCDFAHSIENASPLPTLDNSHIGSQNGQCVAHQTLNAAPKVIHVLLRKLFEGWQRVFRAHKVAAAADHFVPREIPRCAKQLNGAEATKPPWWSTGHSFSEHAETKTSNFAFSCWFIQTRFMVMMMVVVLNSLVNTDDTVLLLQLKLPVWPPSWIYSSMYNKVFVYVEYVVAS